MLFSAFYTRTNKLNVSKLFLKVVVIKQRFYASRNSLHTTLKFFFLFLYVTYTRKLVKWQYLTKFCAKILFKKPQFAFSLCAFPLSQTVFGQHVEKITVHDPSHFKQNHIFVAKYDRTFLRSFLTNYTTYKAKASHTKSNGPISIKFPAALPQTKFNFDQF